MLQKSYVVWLGVKLAKEHGFQKLVIVGDSMLVIKALINHTDPNLKDFPQVLSWVHCASGWIGRVSILPHPSGFE
jgi:hypothetical protein